VTSVITVAVVNLKGGSAKTTTAAYLAHAFHEAEQRTLGVDADGENESLASWQVAGDWPFPVVGMAVANLHKQLPGVVGDRYDAVVIDTPPMREHRGVVLSAARLATHVVVPMAPTPMEYDRLPAVRALLEEAVDLRPDGQAPVLAVLLNRCAPRAASTGVYRELIESDGVHVLKAQVNRKEAFAQAYGEPITNASATAYGDAIIELLDLDTEEVPA
jgi:chromosome partitioning protein